MQVFLKLCSGVAVMLITGCTTVTKESATKEPVAEVKPQSPQMAPVIADLPPAKVIKVVSDDKSLSVDEIVSLAEKYYNGIGVSQDIAKGLSYFVQAADLGSGYACRRLGIEYSDFAFDDKTPRDDAKARAWLEKGAQLGDADATYYLSEFVYEGRGGPKDPARASKLLIQAANMKSQGAAHRALKLARGGSLSISKEEQKNFFALDKNLQLNILAR
ncbi:MAG: sel1 repeat family protein [Holosporales bacterium]|jgi:TPR repeat protein|nr:sel1 repeat family protein [Holosporales bacterium]